MAEAISRSEEFTPKALILSLLAAAGGGVIMSFFFTPSNAPASFLEIAAFGAIGGVLIGLPFIYVERLFGDPIDSVDNGRTRIVLRTVAYLMASLIGFGLAFPVAGLVVFGRVISLPFGRGLLLPAIVSTAIAFTIYAYGLLKNRLEASLTRIKEQEFAEKELELARSIQKRLLPPEELDGPGYRVVARNLAATYVAGDFYDVFHLEDGSLGVAVADVAGKGMGASLIMSTAKAMLPLIASRRTVAGTLSDLNERLRKDLDRREFVALAYARFEPLSGKVTFANAGLPNPFLLRGNDVEEIDVSGPRLPLGMVKSVAYEEVGLTLQPGDRLVLFSDGLPEAPLGDDEQLGYEELSTIMRTTNESEAGAWVDRVLEMVVSRSAGGPDDDCTVLVLERRG